MRTHAARPALTMTVVGIIALGVALSGCGSDGPAADLRSGATGAPVASESPDAPAATDAPPIDTEAPAEPAVTQPPDAPQATAPVTDSGGDDGGLSTWAVILIILGVVAAIAIVGALVGRRKSPTPEPSRAAAPSPQSGLISTSQWIHDQLSLELQAASPASALQRWSIERRRLDDVAIGAQQQFADGNGHNWQLLAQTMSSLASALDTNLQLRAQDPPSAQLIDESVEVVNRNRERLQQVITSLWPTVQR